MNNVAFIGWWAKGLLFENCNCQLVCPGHVHFSNNCTEERCIGYWAIRFDEGSYGDVDLAGVKAVVAYDTPQHMISGSWTEAVIIDDAASSGQQAAVDDILAGRAGGPWEVLGRFVERRLPTRTLPIEITDEAAVKRIAIEGLLSSSIENIRGWDRDQPVTFQNMFNQVHGSTQVLAQGDATYDDGEIAVKNEGTHALHSRFDWSVSPE
ncbi:MAG TPA: DUF1326 domain-containing protein [Gemmatimonadetes bacterium]|nr:DUF1326 domain-containing protein [Gemmatimonadota bacterium]